MDIFWAFKEAGPGDRARESQVEKFFNSDAVANKANAIVREGIQNSLDAAQDAAAIRVRISVGVWSPMKRADHLGKYLVGFHDHFDVPAVRDKIAAPPGPESRFAIWSSRTLARRD